MPNIRGNRAIVLGAGMTGPMAACVLADAFAEVVVVERDELPRAELPRAAAHRRGVPQSRHVHGLLAGGRHALEGLFDGITADLLDLGVPAGDMQEQTRVHIGGYRLQPGRSGLLALQAAGPCWRQSSVHGCVRCRP